MPLDKRFCFHFALKDVRLNSSSKDLAQFYTHRHHNSGLGPMVSISGKLEHQDLPLIVLAISHGACPVGSKADFEGYGRSWRRAAIDVPQQWISEAAVAAALNRQGIKSPNGRAWHPSSVANLIGRSTEQAFL
jgi:hypothetical protein